jgi:hypothetical protein
MTAVDRHFEDSLPRLRWVCPVAAVCDFYLAACRNQYCAVAGEQQVAPDRIEGPTGIDKLLRVIAAGALLAAKRRSRPL